MIIRIAGVALPEGKRLLDHVENGLMKAGMFAEIEKVKLSDLSEKDRNRKLPVMWIDDELVCEGTVLSIKEVQDVLLGDKINFVKPLT